MKPMGIEFGNRRVASSLREVSALLVNSLLGSSAVVYLCDDDCHQLVIPDENTKDTPFVSAVATEAFSDLDLTGGQTSEAGSSILSPHDLSLLIDHKNGTLNKNSTAGERMVMARPLTAGNQLMGLLVMDVGPAPVDRDLAARNIEGAARVIQQNLTQQSELNMLQTQKAFLAHLVTQANEIDITSSQDILISHIVQMVKGVLTFDQLTISNYVAESSDLLNITWVEGSTDTPADSGEYAANGGSCHGKVFIRSQGVLVDNFESSEFMGRFKPGDFGKTKLKSFIGVPIIEASVPQGVLALESNEPGCYNRADLDVLMAISQVFGPAICWLEKYHKVHAMATIDGLTQLLNHRSFMGRLAEELERVVRYGKNMTVLMLDLDNFKEINDTYGHAHGDYVIRQTGQLIRSSIRLADIAGRIGGEEFAVIIINASSADSKSTADRIKDSIANYKFSNDGIRSWVTVSVGMSEYPADGQDPQEILKMADNAMYEVKHAGGNAVATYSATVKKSKKGS